MTIETIYTSWAHNPDDETPYTTYRTRADFDANQSVWMVNYEDEVQGPSPRPVAEPDYHKVLGQLFKAETRTEAYFDFWENQRMLPAQAPMSFALLYTVAYERYLAAKKGEYKLEKEHIIAVFNSLKSDSKMAVIGKLSP